MAVEAHYIKEDWFKHKSGDADEQLSCKEHSFGINRCGR